MYSNKLYTPLRYPGGKARFAPFVSDLMRRNDLVGGHYLEPYAGGAGVALQLLFDGDAEEVHINDADPAVHDFWIAATKLTSDLIYMVRSEPITMAAWRHWRSIMFKEVAASPLERGFATLFMNRCNRSGILKAGVIGGKNQDGNYTLDARFKREVLVTRLSRIGEHARRIHVYGEDALALLKRCHKFLPKKALVYLDPPYYVKGQGLYRNFYEHDDHVAIARLMQSSAFRRPWLVSYDNVEEIRLMYPYAQTLPYGLNYTAQRRYQGAEIMLFAPALRVEEADAPVLAA